MASGDSVSLGLSYTYVTTYYWCRLVSRAEKVIRRKGRSYDTLSNLYEKKRMEDPGKRAIVLCYP